MNYKLIGKLAFSNIKKNRNTLVPFLIASSFTVMVFYILASLAFCKFIYFQGVEAFKGAQTIAIFLEFGSYIVALFSIIFILYANNFVMKERRREIGLYGILGLSGKDVAMLLMIESNLNALICIGSGILAGTVLNKIMLLGLYKIIGQPSVNGFFISQRAVIETLIVFFVIFLICELYNYTTIKLGNPIDLLKSNKTSEREPKVKWLVLVLGVLAIAGGYFKAISCNTTMEAISSFFTATFLVIIGTFFLFTAGSIFFLKLLKNKRGYYYKTKHFISVSNLMYRMKHNAAGLASICVLSTAVILLLTCASSLMLLGEKNIDFQFPNDVKITARNANAKEYYDEAVLALNSNGVETESVSAYSYYSTIVAKAADGIVLADNASLSSYDDMCDIYIFTVDEYNSYTGNNVSLAKNEILISGANYEALDEVRIANNSFVNAGMVDYLKLEVVTDPAMALFDSVFIVMENENLIAECYNQIAVEEESRDNFVYVGIDCRKNLSNEQITGLSNAFANRTENHTISFKQSERELFYSTYGGAFFVGLFLAAIFLMATVLIIYYKQMSEGLEDHDRYKIMKNIGLTDDEVKSTINSQVKLLFFLPAVTAIIHMLVASKIVRLFLGMILIVDGPTFAISTVIVSVVFLGIYFIVYKATSIEYYKRINA